MNPRRRLALSILSILVSACAGAADAPAQTVRIPMLVTAKGFEPSSVAVRKGERVALVITRTTDATCAREIVIDEYGIHTPLPLDTAVTVELTPTESGRIRYGCAMDKMVGGVLVIE